MNSFAAKTSEIQIILETTDPIDENFNGVPTDLLWVNYTTNKIFLLGSDKKFIEIGDDLTEFLKEAAHYHYKQFIICLDKKQVVMLSAFIPPSRGRCLHLSKMNDGLLSDMPTGIITAAGSSGLLLILFQLLIRISPKTHAQLIANIFNSQSIFANYEWSMP
jgi:hypothetical protein